MQAIAFAEQHYRRGIEALNGRRPEDAEIAFRAALDARPDWPEAHHNLGVTLAARAQHAQAVSCYERAIELKADYADALHDLGNSLKRIGRHTEAVARYRAALRLRPDWADAHNNLGLALRGTGALNEALAAFRAALSLRPDLADARNNLGVTLADQGLLDEAVACYRQVLRDRPLAPDAHNNLGVALAQQAKRTEAIVCYRRAIELRPAYAEAHSNLGNALRHEGEFEEAEACLRAAIRLRPDYAEAYNNLAIILVKQERVDEAIANYREALRLKPDYPEARKNLGLALLGKGDYAAGWPEYEYRWGTKEMPVRQIDRPRWDGGPVDGKRILLYAEQGMGDTIQFIRYAAAVAARGATVIVECQKALLGLFAGCAGIERLVAHGETLPEFDLHAPLMSVPGLLSSPLSPLGRGVGGEGSDSAPSFAVVVCRGEESAKNPSPPAPLPNGARGEGGYLSAEPQRVARWREELCGLSGFKIGIAWQGSKGYQDDRFRSIPLAKFEPIARVGGTRLISLQKGYGTEQLGKLRGWTVHDFGDKLDAEGGFLDTAALMKCLDLVITSDTAVAHLAGALGVPCWVALSTAPDWRWLAERADSPWYPTMRLFRQKRRGDWDEVFARIAAALEVLPGLENAARHARRGQELLSAGKPAEAIPLFERALALDPKNAGVHNDRAVALDRAGKKAEALAGFQDAVRFNPNDGNARHNLGNMLRWAGRLAEAEEQYREALRLMPNVPELLNHLGIALLNQGKHAEAEGCFRRCLRMRPGDADARNNLGVVFEQLGKVDEAIACYEEALRHKPDSRDTHKNLALGYLMRGDLLRGFAEYEWRWKAPRPNEEPLTPGPSPQRGEGRPKQLTPGAREFKQPRWDGRPLDGQAILLHAEQGLGDTIQFIRYAPLVQQCGGVVLVECPPALVKLLARCPGIDRIIPQGAPLPEFACHVPFLSLPGVFQTTLATVPAPVPYLSAEPARIAEWGDELARIVGYVCNVPEVNGHVANVPHPPIRIGIAWQGSQTYQGDAHRSIPLRAFAPLAKLQGVRLVSLQKGYGSEQLREVPEWDIIDFGARLDADGAFLDTAAILTQLDLLVTSDSAIAHLAGALGVEVWMATSMAADWRWLREGDQSPWYPTMRLFRQRRWGDWSDVFERMFDELRQRRWGLSAPIMAEIAPGELVDKITILEIKRSRVADEAKLDNIRLELGRLLAARARWVKPSPELERMTAALRAVNEALWDIEDAIRVCEARKDFNSEFIELARSVYRTNDERAALKRAINEFLGARICEVKSYADVKAPATVPIAQYRGWPGS